MKHCESVRVLKKELLQMASNLIAQKRTVPLSLKPVTLALSPDERSPT